MSIRATTDLERERIDRQHTHDPIVLAISSSSNALDTALNVGMYEISSTVDCFFMQAGSTAAATSASHPLYAGEHRYLVVDAAANQNVAAITSGASGSFILENGK